MKQIKNTTRTEFTPDNISPETVFMVVTTVFDDYTSEVKIFRQINNVPEKKCDLQRLNNE